MPKKKASKKVSPRVTKKKVVKKASSNKKTTKKKASASRRPSWRNATVTLAKLGEEEIIVPVSQGQTVLDVFKNAVLPEGAFKTADGRSITNLISAAEASVSRGRANNIAACFDDIRCNASPASLTTSVSPDDIVTLVPNIRGG